MFFYRALIVNIAKKTNSTQDSTFVFTNVDTTHGNILPRYK